LHELRKKRVQSNSSKGEMGTLEKRRPGRVSRQCFRRKGNPAIIRKRKVLEGTKNSKAHVFLNKGAVAKKERPRTRRKGKFGGHSL